MVSNSLIFKLRLRSRTFCLLVCPQTPWLGWTNPNKAWEYSLFANFRQLFVVSYSHADSVAVNSNQFLLFELLFTAVLLPNGHAEERNYLFVVFQSEGTKNNTTTNRSDWLKWQFSLKTLGNEQKKSSTTWQVCLTVWLRCVTLMQSVLVIKYVSSHNLHSIYIKHELFLIVYCEYNNQEWWWWISH